ncbi:hypothetical protein BW12_00535 [Bifidobacterium sp. UTCIF-3]|nr:hypothetical protein BW09_00465 [Bifidobacterium sp. UTCIF-1]TPF80997.1 hypothetical protein BW08_01745 [Bifidobacterium sp. UTCIF-24]TPF83206.1 hypothetical protein BW12_00535 [Bifidobacterium sp. UTCIF-3]TPF85033.1 hypothetical protein BW07_01825 [Bifidobacterium sp. UTCIF-36]TPF90317.1 hypothetical protein BW10_03120 [Bifidobacterium sp. UTBIF-56]
MLKDEAGLGDPDLTWREAAAPFARVSTSHEIDYAKPLNVSAQAPDAHAVKTLEKMFSVFQPIKELEATALDARNRYEVMRRGPGKYGAFRLHIIEKQTGSEECASAAEDG